MLGRPRSSFAFAAFVAVGGFSLALVVACTGGTGSLGEFGDDGVAVSGSQTITSSSSSSSSGRTTSSSGNTTSSSGVTTSSSGNTTSSSGTTTSSSGSTTSSSGSTQIACGSDICTPSAGEYCIKPCCPSQPDCYQAPDGGSCDTGYELGVCDTVTGTACVQACNEGSTAYCSTNTSLPSLFGRTCSTSSTTRTVNCSCN